MRNYYPDENPFHLAAPPKWWLAQLRDFDESLVVVPSRQGFFYRLGQRRKIRLTESVINETLWRESDTRMLASYGLIPVTTIIANPNWSNPLMWKDLEERAPHRMGGHEKVTKLIEERERLADAKRDKETDQHLTDVSKDGWKYYQALTGARTFIDSTKADSRRGQPLKAGQQSKPVPQPVLFGGGSGSQRRIIVP